MSPSSVKSQTSQMSEEGIKDEPGTGEEVSTEKSGTAKSDKDAKNGSRQSSAKSCKCKNKYLLEIENIVLDKSVLYLSIH